MSYVLPDLLNSYHWTVIAYMLTVNTIYFVLLLLGFIKLLRYRYVDSGPETGGARELSPLVLPVSILVPAYNEATTICETVRAMVALRYPEFEVIVINDGSKDRTLSILMEEFHLYRSARFYEASLPTKPIRGVYESMDPIPLIVVDKENGGKADALNAGLKLARYPLFCSVDADSVLETNALLRVAYPFIEDSQDEVLAVGGIIRVANGCEITKGQVNWVGLSPSWIVLFQTVEYLRAFLLGRTGFGALNCVLIISGAFGMFRKKAVLEVGGFDTEHVSNVLGDDMEMVFRLHRWARENGKKYRILSLPDPVCWTEVPESLRSLKSQRVRWQHAIIATVWLHRGMLGRPRYGLFGMFALPYTVLFEVFAPVVELSGYLITLIGISTGTVDWKVAGLLLGSCALYGTMLSQYSVVFEQVTIRRYPAVRDLLILMLAGLVENLGFRQLFLVWRTWALVEFFRGRRPKLESLKRRGFRRPESSARPR